MPRLLPRKRQSILTREQYLARLHRWNQYAKVQYFLTGIWPDPPVSPHFQTSSSYITENTLFVCHQSHHRS